MIISYINYYLYPVNNNFIYLFMYVFFVFFQFSSLCAFDIHMILEKVIVKLYRIRTK